MRNNKGLQISLLVLMTVMLLFYGCSTSDHEKLSHIYGEWKVEEIQQVMINNSEETLLTKEYLIEFDEENCGTTYDLDKEKLNSIKWGYQWTNGIDRFMIATQLENAFGSSDFSISNLYEVGKLEEDEFLLSQEVITMQNDTTIAINKELILTR